MGKKDSFWPWIFLSHKSKVHLGFRSQVFNFGTPYAACTASSGLKVQHAFLDLECHSGTQTPALISSSGVPFLDSKSSTHFNIWSAIPGPKVQHPFHRSSKYHLNTGHAIQTHVSRRNGSHECHGDISILNGGHCCYHHHRCPSSVLLLV